MDQVVQEQVAPQWFTVYALAKHHENIAIDGERIDIGSYYLTEESTDSPPEGYTDAAGRYIFTDKKEAYLRLCNLNKKLYEDCARKIKLAKWNSSST